ncbi:MAG: hypothetical protein IJX81_03540 [Clostridia bacterium]|nr:hypothetical protein [Clostridia bacterium]
MTEEKLRKMITGATVAATLLIVCLLAVLVFQWIKMGVQQRRYEEALAEQRANEQLVEELGGYLGYITSELGKTDLAMQDGWLPGGGN